MVVWNKQNPLDDRLSHTANDARSSSSSSNQSEHGDTRTGSSPLAVPGRRWGSPCSLSHQFKFARLRTFTPLHFGQSPDAPSQLCCFYLQAVKYSTTTVILLSFEPVQMFSASLECVPLPLSIGLISFFVGFEFFFHFCFYHISLILGLTAPFDVFRNFPNQLEVLSNLNAVIRQVYVEDFVA